MSELEREILIDASPETIFPFLTDPAQHLLWEGTEVELDPRPGGVYRVVVAGNYVAAGEFIEVVPNEKVVFSFGWDMLDNPIKPGSTTVEYTLHPEGGKTLLRLRHTGLPDDDAVAMHTHGWDHYLARLATASVGGDPGPDTGPGDA
jgi:uncharacterized protein YndB with AHSA1/START domain